MRHLVAKKRLSRSTSHRIAMMRNIVTSLIEHERITTTVTKAKELRKLADQMITLGKMGTLHARRRALSVVRKKSAVSKLFTDLASRFQNRSGGYTRVLKVGFRHGDNAEMAIIEYVDYQPKQASKSLDTDVNSSKTETKVKKSSKGKPASSSRKKKEPTNKSESVDDVKSEKAVKKPRKTAKKVEKSKEE